MPEATPPNRRSFVRRAAVAALGAAAAAPIVGARSASAAGTEPAYTDSPNTFQGDQRIDGRLGIQTAPHYPLEIRRADNGAAAKIQGHTMALIMTHDVDWAGQTHDLVDLYHRSCGDGIFIAHQGGKPAGFTDPIGGNAGLNVLVPYHIDNTTTGRDGTVVNDRTGMQGLHVETQAVVDDSHAIHVQHFAHGYAFRMFLQTPGMQPETGRGGGLWIDDWSTASTIRVTKRSQPNSSSEAIINLRGLHASPMDAFHVRDGNDQVRFRVRTDGIVTAGFANLNGSSNAVLRAYPAPSGHSQESFRISGDGRLHWGAGGSTVVDTNLYRSAADTLKTDDSLHVGATLRHLGSSLGFFNAAPVSKQTVSGNNSTQALTNLLTALSRLGLITDSTSA